MRVLLSVLSLSIVACASAKTITQKFTFNMNFDNSIVSVNVNRFNPALGTLTGVTVRTFARVSGRVDLENQNSAPMLYAGAHSVGFGVNVFTTVAGTDFYLQYNPLTTNTRGIKMGAYDGVSDFAGPSSTSYGFSGTASVLDTFMSPGTLALVKGVGTVTIKLQGGYQSNWSWITPMGVSEPVVQVAAGGSQSLVVIYEYSPS